MRKNNQSGYAILFSVVVVGIILVIAFGLSNITYKQLVLSSLAKESQTAFYQADLASECGLYHDWHLDSFTPVDSETPLVDSVSCGGEDFDVEYGNCFNNRDFDVNYCIKPKDQKSNKPCFRIEFIVNEEENTTIMRANGYNICNVLTDRTVERTIEVTY